jgi:peroxiredoxin
MHVRLLAISILGLAWLGCDRSASATPTPAQSASAPVSTAAPPAAPAPAAAAAAPRAQAELGKPAPEFQLRDTEGKAFTLAELRGKTVVLEWFNPDCPFIKSAHTKGPLVDMAKQVRGPSLVWLSINSSAPGKQGHGVERNTRAKAEYRMENPVLLDESGSVGKAYGALKTPHLFVIDPQGVLVYRGGLDNAPMGVVDDERPRPEGTPPEQLVPYLRNALADLQAGRAIALADTPPYGCSVKYAD